MLSYLVALIGIISSPLEAQKKGMLLDLFDFDRVEIQQATDEEVERFAVQVGNDTDELSDPVIKR
jgi:hypothetical protein